MKNRTAYCLSDHTGVTAEALATSVLAQFPAFEFSLIVLPFLDTPDKVRAAIDDIATTPDALVFSTLADPALRAAAHAGTHRLFDLFDLFGPPLEAALGQAATPSGGRTHGMSRDYEARIDAVNFSLALDDGLHPQRLDQADLILVGVSRVGKTPTALYLALQYGLRAANYPLTPKDLAQADLPAALSKHVARLYALTLTPERLAAIRQARYPGSDYASLAQCCHELTAAERLYARHDIEVVDTTRLSVEEIAARLRRQLAH